MKEELDNNTRFEELKKALDDDMIKKIETLLYSEYKTSNGNLDKIFTQKSNFINKLITLNENCYLYINTITKNNSLLPYMMLIPKNINENNNELIVSTINSRDNETTKNKVNDFLVGLSELTPFLKVNIAAPVLIGYIPKFETGKENNDQIYYQQLSKECFINKNFFNQRLDIMFKNSILDAMQNTKKWFNKSLKEKVCIYGYSTTGIFAQRFSFIHPEIINKAIIGGAAGTIPMPDNKLSYPLGTKDYYQLFGKEFNEDAYKIIQMAYFVAENESKEIRTQITDKGKTDYEMHDMSFKNNSTPIITGSQFRYKYGQTLSKRFQSCINQLENGGYSIRSKIYKDADHKSLFSKNYEYATELKKDLIQFYNTGIKGNGFKKDRSSAERIKENQELIDKKIDIFKIFDTKKKQRQLDSSTKTIHQPKINNNIYNAMHLRTKRKQELQKKKVLQKNYKNKGYINIILLSLITSFICEIIFVLVNIIK